MSAFRHMILKYTHTKKAHQIKKSVMCTYWCTVCTMCILEGRNLQKLSGLDIGKYTYQKWFIKEVKVRCANINSRCTPCVHLFIMMNQYLHVFLHIRGEDHDFMCAHVPCHIQEQQHAPMGTRLLINCHHMYSYMCSDQAS